MIPGEDMAAFSVGSAAQKKPSVSAATHPVTAEIPGTPLWFAIWTHSQCEVKVEETLLRKQFEVFLPRVRMPSRRRDRRVVLVRPLFPGYLFLRLAPSRTAYIS